MADTITRFERISSDDVINNAAAFDWLKDGKKRNGENLVEGSFKRRKPFDLLRYSEKRDGENLVEEGAKRPGDAAVPERTKYLSIQETKGIKEAHESFIMKVTAGLRLRNYKKGTVQKVSDAMAQLRVERYHANKAKAQNINAINKIDSVSLGKEIVHYHLAMSHPGFHDLYASVMEGNRQEAKNIIGIMRDDLKADKPLAKMSKEGKITFQALQTHEPGLPDDTHTPTRTDTITTKVFKDLTYCWQDANTNNFVLSTSHANTLAEAQSDKQAYTYTITPKTLFRLHEGTLMAAEDIDFEKTLRPNRYTNGRPPEPQKTRFYHKEGYEVELGLLDEMGQPKRERDREAVRRNYDKSTAHHLSDLEQAIETGTSEFMRGQMQKIFREDMATKYLFKDIEQAIIPAQEDLQIFYNKRHLDALQKQTNSFEILAKALKDPAFLQPIHAYTENIEDIEKDALKAGVAKRDLRDAWQHVISKQTPLALESHGNELFTDRSSLQKTCLDINGTDDISTVRDSIQSLAERKEAVISHDATPREKVRLALKNATIQDHNAKVQALKHAFDVWDSNKTAENADAVKMTASHIEYFTAKNDYNRKCQLTAFGDDTSILTSSLHKDVMIKEGLPLSTKKVDDKFDDLCKEIPEFQEIDRLTAKLDESKVRDIYTNPAKLHLLVNATVDKLAPLVVSAQIKLLINEGKDLDATVLIEQQDQREASFKENYQRGFEDSLKRYHDMEKIKLAHTKAMKHLWIYALMFLGANADQVAANSGQDFQQAANNIFRMVAR